MKLGKCVSYSVMDLVSDLTLGSVHRAIKGSVLDRVSDSVRRSISFQVSRSVGRSTYIKL